MEKEQLQIDEQTLTLVKQGDLKAFNKMMGIYQKAIFNHLYRLTGSKDDAADLAQDTFFKVYKKHQTIDPAQNFKAWLYKIATHTAYDWFAKKKRQNEMFLPDENELETIDQNLPYYRIEEANRLDLEAALNKLKPSYQTAIILYYREGFGYEEIAAIMRIPLGTVKTLLYRAKKALADELK